jgi:hypothetical protein
MAGEVELEEAEHRSFAMKKADLSSGSFDAIPSSQENFWVGPSIGFKWVPGLEPENCPTKDPLFRAWCSDPDGADGPELGGPPGFGCPTTSDGTGRFLEESFLGLAQLSDELSMLE